MEEQYNPFRTAISRSGLSVPMRELVNLNVFNLADKYMDIDIVGYDKYNEEYKDDRLLDNTYDLVTCNYVFNVIDLDEHKRLLNKIKLLSENIYISVRSDSRAIKNNGKYIKDN